MNFKVGQKAVYPMQGVGIIKSIEQKIIAGKKKYFYILQVQGSKSMIMIPKDNAESVGLRKIITKDKVQEIFDILKKQPSKEIIATTWNKRYRLLSDKLRNGKLENVASVYRDLVHLKTIKALSFGERKLLEIAEKLLIKELSEVLQKTEHKIKKELMSLINFSK